MLYDYKIMAWTYKGGTRICYDTVVIQATDRFDAYDKFHSDKFNKVHCVIMKTDFTERWSVVPGVVHDTWTDMRN